MNYMYEFGLLDGPPFLNEQQCEEPYPDPEDDDDESAEILMAEIEDILQGKQ